MKTLFHFLPYVLSFFVLKPIITFFAYPARVYKERFETFEYHMDKYFDIHNEVFFYSLILVVLVYSIINYKTLSNFDSKKASNWWEEPKMKE
tara:strand:+ start:1085 stop:1360 length:276 start_codon:yes stop_codon:yes gene_type:complete